MESQPAVKQKTPKPANPSAKRIAPPSHPFEKLLGISKAPPLRNLESSLPFESQSNDFPAIGTSRSNPPKQQRRCSQRSLDELSAKTLLPSKISSSHGTRQQALPPLSSLPLLSPAPSPRNLPLPASPITNHPKRAISPLDKSNTLRDAIRSAIQSGKDKSTILSYDVKYRKAIGKLISDVIINRLIDASRGAPKPISLEAVEELVKVTICENEHLSARSVLLLNRDDLTFSEVELSSTNQDVIHILALYLAGWLWKSDPQNLSNQNIGSHYLKVHDPLASLLIEDIDTFAFGKEWRCKQIEKTPWNSNLLQLNSPSHPIHRLHEMTILDLCKLLETLKSGILQIKNSLDPDEVSISSLIRIRDRTLQVLFRRLIADIQSASHLGEPLINVINQHITCLNFARLIDHFDQKNHHLPPLETKSVKQIFVSAISALILGENSSYNRFTFPSVNPLHAICEDLDIFESYFYVDQLFENPVAYANGKALLNALYNGQEPPADPQIKTTRINSKEARLLGTLRAKPHLIGMAVTKNEADLIIGLRRDAKLKNVFKNLYTWFQQDPQAAEFALRSLHDFYAIADESDDDNESGEKHY